MLKLNFSLYSSAERNAFVSAFFAQNPNYIPTQHELDTLSNYILYGKDADGLSVVDRHEVEIETKYGSYKRREVESLEGLSESGDGADGAARGVGEGVRYKKGRVEIGEEDLSLPGIAELKVAIAAAEEALEALDEAVAAEADPAAKRALQSRAYRVKHYLIDLRKQQYVVKEAAGRLGKGFNPGVRYGNGGSAAEGSDGVDWDEVVIYPLGLVNAGRDGRFNPMVNENSLFHLYTTKSPGLVSADLAAVASKWDKIEAEGIEKIKQSGKKVIDFTDKEQIYTLVKMAAEMETEAERDPEAVSGGLLETLKFYCGLAKLSEAQIEILKCKMERKSNEEIAAKLKEKFGLGYGENYISTIFKKRICGEVAAAARLHADKYFNRGNENAWKVCRVCGERKLRDNREFIRKSNASDGFSNRCKDCDKAARKLKTKGGTNE